MSGNTDVLNSSNMPNRPDTTYRNTLQKNNMLGGNVTLGYKRDFGKNHYLDFTAAYNTWNMDGSSKFTQENYFNSKNDTSYQYQTTARNNQMLDFKLDYSNQIKENHRIEAGYQGTFSNSKAPQETFSGFHKDSLTITPALCNNMLYNQYVNAFYAVYAGKYKDFNYQVGMRGELTNTYVRSESATGIDSYPDTYFDVFPSLFLSYTFPKDHQLQVNYTRRITRPGGWRLNPFKNISDSTNIQFGNPYLLPEFSNAFELNYIKSWTNHIFSFSGYFRNTDGVMQRISFLDETDQMYSTFINISQTISSGAELVLKNKLFKFLNLTTTVNLFYFYLKDFKYTLPNTNTIIYGKKQSNFS
jgi:outer membrane receptor protein involved in Fe transport